MSNFQEKILPLGPSSNANSLFVGLYNGDRGRDNVQAIAKLVEPWGLEVGRTLVGDRSDAKPALLIRSRENMEGKQFNRNLEKLATTLRDKERLIVEGQASSIGEWNMFRLLSLFTDAEQVNIFNNPQILDEFTALLES